MSLRRRDTPNDSSALHAARRLAQPERNVWRRAACVFHAQAVAFDALDAVAGVAKLKDVAGHAFDGKVLVHRADDDRLRLQYDFVISRVGDGAAGHQRGKPCAAPRAQLAVHRIAMQVGRARALAGGEALGQHAHHGVEIRARQRPIRPRATHQIVQRILAPLLARHFGDDLLRQHVERLRRQDQYVQQRRAFDQVVAGGGEQQRLRRAADAVAGAPGALQKSGDGSRRAELADQIHIADIDAQLQRRGGHQHRQFAALEPLFRVQPQLLGQAAVMRGDGFLAQPVGQMPCRAFGHPPRVDEHQRRAMRLHPRGDLVVHQLPAVVGHHRFQRHRRHDDGQIARAVVAHVDDGAGEVLSLRVGERAG
jgi:hypothetical protein